MIKSAMVSRLQIKHAVKDNAGEIEVLLENSFVEFKPVYTEEAYNATAVKKKEIIERMKEGPVWIAVLHGKIIGTVSVVIKDDSVYIRGMAVRPEARGKKIGEKLLNEAEKYAHNKKIKRLYLGTTKYLKSAIKLYERNGFKKSKLANFYGMGLVIMEKWV